jgi:hypothetical protein
MEAIFAEIDQIADPKVSIPMHYKDIPIHLRHNIIRVWMFHKAKYQRDGSFDKEKCRIVTLSQNCNKNTIGETFSPTVNPMSFFLQLQLTATTPSTLMSAYYIKGAFLQAPVQNGVYIFVEVDKDLTAHWIQCHPVKSFLTGDGRMYLRIHRYIYGMQ